MLHDMVVINLGKHNDKEKKKSSLIMLRKQYEIVWNDVSHDWLPSVDFSEIISNGYNFEKEKCT